MTWKRGRIYLSLLEDVDEEWKTVLIVSSDPVGELKLSAASVPEQKINQRGAVRIVLHVGREYIRVPIDQR